MGRQQLNQYLRGEVEPSPEMLARLANGHNQALKPVPNWDLPTLAGAGALRSTVNDMLKFVAANLGLTKSPSLLARADEVIQ